jgi:ABC-type uncharacterized transport system permease subunit
MSLILGALVLILVGFSTQSLLIGVTAGAVVSTAVNVMVDWAERHG